jgi:hypothetical protein
MPAYVFPHSRGCPFPSAGYSISAAPPPSPPATTLTITMTDDGTMWNGYGQYVGLTVSSQSTAGTITVYAGPDTTFPVIHQITTPQVGLTYYAPGVTYSDANTYIEATTIYVVHAGASQTVNYIVYDE